VEEIAKVISLLLLLMLLLLLLMLLLLILMLLLHGRESPSCVFKQYCNCELSRIQNVYFCN
jgi:hypothetical protein